MRFWDASALVPLVVEEEESPALVDLYSEDPEVLTWWGTEVECVSALARLERSEELRPDAAAAAFQHLAALASTWHILEATDALRRTAIRVLRTHDLRAADSLQLAAALVASENQPSSLEFVCRDRRLALAAGREALCLV